MTDNESDSSEETLAYPPIGEREQPLILLADDDPDILNILSLFFEDKRCDLLQANNGADALESIIVHQPDLLILDVMMPELNGWQVCKYVKTHDEFKEISIVMLTAIGPVNNELTSPLFGADDYIDKPFEFEELESKVRKVLASKGQGYPDVFGEEGQD